MNMYQGKERQLTGAYAEMVLHYWECNKRGDERKEEKQRMKLLDHIKRRGSYDGM